MTSIGSQFETVAEDAYGSDLDVGTSLSHQQVVYIVGPVGWSN